MLYDFQIEIHISEVYFRDPKVSVNSSTSNPFKCSKGIFFHCHSNNAIPIETLEYKFHIYLVQI